MFCKSAWVRRLYSKLCSTRHSERLACDFTISFFCHFLPTGTVVHSGHFMPGKLVSFVSLYRAKFLPCQSWFYRSLFRPPHGHQEVLASSHGLAEAICGAVPRLPRVVGVDLRHVGQAQVCFGVLLTGWSNPRLGFATFVSSCSKWGRPKLEYHVFFYFGARKQASGLDQST